MKSAKKFVERQKIRIFSLILRFAFVSLFAATVLGTLIGCGTAQNDSAIDKIGLNVSTKTDATVKIVSTVPSVTETLFELGLGESVVAVSNYCQYPPEIANLPKIGSLFDFNVEAIVELAPDFVVILKENDELRRRLGALGIETVAVDASTLDGVLASFATLGRLGGDESAKRAEALRAETERKIAAIRESVAGLGRPKTLIAIDRTAGIGKISDVFVAGKNPYFDAALEIVGATNAAGELAGAVPVVGPEGIAALNPEIIVDLSTDGVYSDATAAATKIAERRADWESLGKHVAAVKNGKVYPILDLYATVPGPRTILFLENLADKIHPERNHSAEIAPQNR